MLTNTGSSSIYQNTPTKFTNELARAFEFSPFDSWVVGLRHISFNKSWLPCGESHEVQMMEVYSVRGTPFYAELLEPKHSLTDTSSVTELANSLNRILEKSFSSVEVKGNDLHIHLQVENLSASPLDEAFKTKMLRALESFGANLQANVFDGNLSKIEIPIFNNELLGILGLSEKYAELFRGEPIVVNGSLNEKLKRNPPHVPEELVAKTRVAYNSLSVKSIHVLSDICVPTCCGDRFMNLLDVLDPAVGLAHGTQVHTRVKSPLYKPVSKYFFNSVQIELKTQDGKPLNIPNAYTEATLHFKKLK
ncbi:hypothetical protein HDE_02633 [Halotydeus destructor]|nr:hypothetical protein HDE_02633 [Halotydeus destructor]